MFTFTISMLINRPDRLVAVLAEVGQSMTGVTLFATPLGAEFLAIVVLLLLATLMALAVGCLFKLGLKSPWKDALLAAGGAFVGTFGIGYMIIIYLMPSIVG